MVAGAQVRSTVKRTKGESEDANQSLEADKKEGADERDIFSSIVSQVLC